MPVLTSARSQAGAAREGVDRLGVALLAVIALAVVYAYLPSLGHAPRGDQWPFLMDMMRQESCGDFISHSYSYNRTRVILPGDTALFRPLLFVYLSLMACMGGTHVWFPQAAGIALHLGVAWLAFTVFRGLLVAITANRIAANLMAALAALYFATTPAIMEQVIWAHVNAYMLATLCVLGVIHVQRVAVTNGGITPRQVAATIALSAIACFSFEPALFLPLLLALCAATGWLPAAKAAVSIRSRLRLAMLFLAPVAIYFGAYVLDQHIHPVEDDAWMDSLGKRAASLNTAMNLVRFLAFSVAYPFVAGKPEGFTGTRLLVAEPSQALALLVVALLACIAGVVIAGGYAARCLGERPRRAALLAGAITLAWLVATALMYTIGRINPNPTSPTVLATSSYQSYAPYLAATLLLVIASGCVAAMVMNRPGARRPRRWVVLAGVALAVLAIGVRAGLVHSVNAQLARHLAPLVDAVDAINAVRGRDPFATFRMSAHTAESLERFQGVPVLYTLFVRSIDQCGGRYEIVAGSPHVAIAADHTACYPILARPDTNFHYYYYRGEYFGLPFWFAFPDEEKIRNNPYLVRAPTLEAAMLEQPARLERLLRDLNDKRIFMPEPQPFHRYFRFS